MKPLIIIKKIIKMLQDKFCRKKLNNREKGIYYDTTGKVKPAPREY
jgi:hypothetical protein